MKKEIFKDPIFLLAIFNFLMGMFFIFQDALIARPASFILQFNFIILLHLAQKNQNKKN